MDLKLTDAELLALMPTWARSEDGVKWSKPAPLELTNLGVARFAADAATAKAAWALYEKLEASDRRLEGDVIGPLWGAGYWAGWDSARDALKWHTEAAGLPPPEEVAR